MAIDDDILLELQNQTAILKAFAGARASAGSSSGGTGIPLEDASNAAKDLASSLYSGAKTIGTTLLGMNEKFANLNTALTALPFGLGVLGGIIANTVDQYREFLAIGQTFNGSMVDMATMAAATSQSMEDMHKMAKAAGPALGALGMQRVAQLSDAVRQGTRDFASFGLTVNQTNEYLGDMLETQRMLGVLGRLNEQKASQAFNELQMETMALSKITGKAREEILKQTMALQRQNVALTGYLGSLPEEMREQVQKSVQGAVTMFASLPGQAGEVMSNALIDGLSTGSVWMSETFSQIGMLAPGVAQALEETRRIAQTGGDTTQAAIGSMEALRNISEGQMRNLAMWAASGDQAAKQTLELAQAVKGLTFEEFEREKERATLYGGAETEFLNFNQNMKTIFAEIRLAFLQLLGPSLKALSGEGGKGLISKLADTIRDFVKGAEFEKMGLRIRFFVEDVIDMLPTVGETVGYISDAGAAFLEWLGILNEHGDFDIEGLSRTFKQLQSVLYKVVAGILDIASWVTDIDDATIEGIRKKAEAIDLEIDASARRSAAIAKAKVGDNFVGPQLPGYDPKLAGSVTAINTLLASTKLGLGEWDPANPGQLITAPSRAQNQAEAEQMISDLRETIMADKKVSETEAAYLAMMEENNRLTKDMIAKIAEQANVSKAQLEEQIKQAKLTSSPGTD